MKRFYKTVAVAPAEGGWQVQLDGRGIRTAARHPQIVPGRALAEALAAEWAGQGEEINAAAFIFRDMADYALDMVTPDPAIAIAAILPYGETDTLCYRDEQGSALWRRQMERWEPLLAATEARYDVHFERISGILHRPQPDETMARMAAVLAALPPFALAALQTCTSLAASLIIGLAALEAGADAAALWDAASLEEDWQAEMWGHDAEAQALRASRFASFAAAMRFAGLAAGD